MMEAYGAYINEERRQLHSRNIYEREVLEEHEYDKYEYVVLLYTQKYGDNINYNDPDLNQKFLDLEQEFSNTHWKSIRELKRLPALSYALEKYYEHDFHYEFHRKGKPDLTPWEYRAAAEDAPRYDYSKAKLSIFKAEDKRLMINQLTNGYKIFKHLVLRQYVNDYYDIIRREKLRQI